MMEALSGRVRPHGRVITSRRSAPADRAPSPPAPSRFIVSPAVIAASIAALAAFTIPSFDFQFEPSGAGPLKPAAEPPRGAVAANRNASSADVVPRSAQMARQVADTNRRNPKVVRATTEAPPDELIRAQAPPAASPAAQGPTQIAQLNTPAAVDPPLVASLAEPLSVATVEVAQREPEAPPPILVTRQAALTLLGRERSNRSGSPLGDIRSGNPLRMASAITGGGR
jgi:hypothetical protein